MHRLARVVDQVGNRLGACELTDQVSGGCQFFQFSDSDIVGVVRGHAGSPGTRFGAVFVLSKGPTDQGQCKKSSKKSGHKKTARLRWRFFGKLGFYTNDSPLSIRQRLEIPKKVKIKLGGHAGFGRLVKIERLAL